MTKKNVPATPEELLQLCEFKVKGPLIWLGLGLMGEIHLFSKGIMENMPHCIDKYIYTLFIVSAVCLFMSLQFLTFAAKKIRLLPKEDIENAQKWLPNIHIGGALEFAAFMSQFMIALLAILTIWDIF